MSVEAITIALHHSTAKGSAKLVLIGIANHAGDGGAWPAVATLMKYAGISDRRHVQRILVQLEQKREIKRLIQQGGDSDMALGLRPNLYKFTLRCPADCDGSVNHRRRKEPALIDVEEMSTPQNGGGLQTTPMEIQGRSTDPEGGGAQTALTVIKPTTKTQSIRKPTIRTPLRFLGMCATGAPHRVRYDDRCADCWSTVDLNGSIIEDAS